VAQASACGARPCKDQTPQAEACTTTPVPRENRAKYRREFGSLYLSNVSFALDCRKYLLDTERHSNRNFAHNKLSKGVGSFSMGLYTGLTT